MKCETPSNERERLETLRDCRILDTPAEEVFDDITFLAAHICAAPIALISFTDSKRNWFKSKEGLDMSEVARDIAFCAHAIVQPNEMFIVADASKEERFANSPLVQSDPKIRFFAGVPLVTREGFALGTLCVMDRVPRELSREQLLALRVLSRQVVTELEFRRKARALEQSVTDLQAAHHRLNATAEQARLDEELRQSQERYRSLFEAIDEGFCIIEVLFDEHCRPHDWRFLEVNPAFERHNGLYNAKGKTIREVAPGIESDWFEIYGKVALTGEPIRLVKFSQALNRWFDLYASPVGAPEERKISVIFSDITERKQTEEALKDTEASLRELTAHLLRVQDHERRRIGRELHDSTAQSLAALEMNLAMITKRAEGLDRRTREILEESSWLAGQASAEVRTISYLLHPPLLDELGLISALKWYTQGFTQRSGIAVELRLPEDLGRLPEEVELALFRIVQESLSNVHRHSRSKKASLRIARDDDGVKLEVEDAGTGIPDATLRRAARGTTVGVGLAGMRERARQLAGLFEIVSNPEGTLIRVVLPVKRKMIQ